MRGGTWIFQKRKGVFYRGCWNLMTCQGGGAPPANVGRAANLMDGSTLTATGRLQLGPFYLLSNERGRQLRRPYFHVADGGSMSGASGVTSGDAPSLSTCNFRSAALSNKAAEIFGSVVALASPNRIAA